MKIKITDNGKNYRRLVLINSFGLSLAESTSLKSGEITQVSNDIGMNLIGMNIAEAVEEKQPRYSKTEKKETLDSEVNNGD